MSRKRLPPKTITLWQLRIAIFCAIIICVVAYVFRRFKWCLFVIIGLLVLLAIVALIYIPALCRSYCVEAKNGAVIVKHGVIIKTTHIMPFSKVIYAQTVSTPLAKTMGLTAITLKATKSIVFVPEMFTQEVDDLAKKIG